MSDEADTYTSFLTYNDNNNNNDILRLIEIAAKLLPSFLKKNNNDTKNLDAYSLGPKISNHLVL